MQSAFPQKNVLSSATVFNRSRGNREFGNEICGNVARDSVALSGLCCFSFLRRVSPYAVKCRAVGAFKDNCVPAREIECNCLFQGKFALNSVPAKGFVTEFAQMEIAVLALFSHKTNSKLNHASARNSVSSIAQMGTAFPALFFHNTHSKSANGATFYSIGQAQRSPMFEITINKALKERHSKGDR